jgi:hypothetical protein
MRKAVLIKPEPLLQLLAHLGGQALERFGYELRRVPAQALD